ncbi:MAG TPA: ribosomal L7Ae/L30e/S12e/Gadd45 family protein [Nitrososphaerales archaeon]|nr:ribosomal L7Ae/L30e/S12e/Gadd45 family protein [Nitrososphaerales archaeon]
MDTAHLSKVLKEAMKGGKYTLGAKETIYGMKGAKALLLTKSVPEGLLTRLKAEAAKHDVTVVELPVTSAQLARMVGRPYSVSAVALRSVSEADIKQLLR